MPPGALTNMPGVVQAAKSKVSNMEDIRARMAAQNAKVLAETAVATGKGNLPVYADPIQHNNPPLTPGYDKPGSFITLRLNEIKCFDKNPRVVVNPKFDEIKEMLRQLKRVPWAFNVTKRPGDSIYMLSAGGNTRLQAIQDLYQESNDPVWFDQIPCYFTEYVSEAFLIAQHISENENRGETCFWDKVNGAKLLKEELEKELGEPISLRKLAEYAKNYSSDMNPATLSFYQFSWLRLNALGSLTSKLTRNDVRDCIRPRLSQLVKISNALGLQEDVAYEKIFIRVFNQYENSLEDDVLFSAIRICDLCEVAIADYFGKSSIEIKSALNFLLKNPDAADIDILRRMELQQSDQGDSSSNEINTSTASSITASSAEPTVASPIIRPSTQGSTTTTPSPVLSNSESLTDSGPTHTPTVLEAENKLGLSTNSHQASELNPEITENELVNQVINLAETFAEMTGVSDDFQRCPELPVGFYMEVPSTHLDSSLTPDNRYFGWWMLKDFSLQHENEVALRMPKDSYWRKIFLCEDGHTDYKLIEVQESLLIGPIDFHTIIKWLTNPAKEPYAKVYLQLIESIRQLRLNNPKRFLLNRGAK